MTVEYTQGTDDRHRMRAQESRSGEPRTEVVEQADTEPGRAHTVLQHSQVRGRGNESVRATTIQRMQTMHGNRAVQRWSFGWDPAEKDEGPRPHLYAKSTGHYGVDAGFSLFSGHSPLAPVTGSLIYGQGRAGGWEEEGGVQYGLKGNLGFNKMGFNEGGQVSGDIGLLTAGGEANIGENGLRVGGGAALAEGSMTLNKFTRGDTAESNMRFGLSEGPSWGGRIHWGDSDDDEHSEYGFGLDAGPGSFDYKSEDPIRSALAGSLSLPVAPYLGPFGLGMFTADQALKKMMGGANMTDKAADYGVNALGRAAGVAASPIYDLIDIMTNIGGPKPSRW